MLAKGTSNLTAREREILALAWKCFHTAPSVSPPPRQHRRSKLANSVPQVDYKQLATKAELKNAASATTAFLSAKKKMLAAADGSAIPESKPAAAKKPRKTLPSARNRDGADEGEETVVEPASPPMKKRKRANAAMEMWPKSAAILAAVEGGDEGEEEVKPKRGRKGKGKKARSELEGGEDEGQGMVKSEPEREGEGDGDGGDVDAGLFASAQEFLKGKKTSEKLPLMMGDTGKEA